MQTEVTAEAERRNQGSHQAWLRAGALPFCHDIPLQLSFQREKFFLLFFCASLSILRAVGRIYPKVSSVYPSYFIFVASIPPFTPCLTTMWPPPTCSCRRKELTTSMPRVPLMPTIMPQDAPCKREPEMGKEDYGVGLGQSQALGGKDGRGNVGSGRCQPPCVA